MSHCGERIHTVMLVKILHLKGNTEKNAFCTIYTHSTDTEIKGHFKTKMTKPKGFFFFYVSHYFNLHALENPLDLEEHEMRLWHLVKVRENKQKRKLKKYTNT